MRTTISPEPALLGFLLDGPMHGYDLYKQVDANLGLMWRVGMSQMYAIVNTYVARGWIRTQIQPQALRPSKKILEITATGRQAFEAWLNQPAHGLREFRVDFFLRLYFVRRVGAPAVRRLIARQSQAVESELAKLEQHRIAATDEEGALFQLTRNFRLQQLNAIQKWLESNRQELLQLAQPSNRMSLHRSARLRLARPRRKTKPLAKREAK